MSKDYVLSRKIAAGGMAEVLLAARTGASGFEKLVVLKRILPHLKEDGQFLQMFLNEARLAGLLKHPNIVEIYDVERRADDFLVVMEYLSGEDLRYIINHLRQDRQPMDVGIACRIISDAAAALDFAHTAEDTDGKPMSVVHRDVAPGNILVTYDGVTKLLDFGIAKATTRATYTIPGTMKGKFAYMSPEHVQQQPLDARSDIFSLGVVFWELLAAQRLFKGTNDAAVLKQVMELEIPPPSTYNANLPPELDAIVGACLERDRDRRIRSALQVRVKIEAFLTAHSMYVTASQVGEWMRDTLPWRYHQRKEMERAVILEARDGKHDADGRKLSSAGSNDFRPGRATTSGFSSPNRTLLGNSNASSSAYPGAPGSLVLPRSQISDGSARSPHLTPLTARYSIATVVAIAVVSTLLVVLLAGGFYWLGRSLSSKSSTVFVHAVPDGSTVMVDGRILSHSVGPAGVPIGVEPSRRIYLVVSKPGRIPQDRAIITPESGERHIYFTLSKAP